MEFYILKNAVTRKKVGRYMQTKGFVEGYDQYGPNSMLKLDRGVFPNFVPDLRFDLEEKAKLTDVVSVGNIEAYGLMINEKVKRIFESCQLPEHRYYDATINVNGEIHKYYWLHLLYCNKEIDYVNSSFYATYAFVKSEKVEVKSNADYWKKQREYVDKGDPIQTIRAEKIKLLPTFDRYDMLIFDCALLRAVGEIFISSELKEKLEKEKVTGIDIEPQDVLLPL